MQARRGYADHNATEQQREDASLSISEKLLAVLSCQDSKPPPLDSKKLVTSGRGGAETVVTSDTSGRGDGGDGAVQNPGDVALPAWLSFSPVGRVASRGCSRRTHWIQFAQGKPSLACHPPPPRLGKQCGHRFVHCTLVLSRPVSRLGCGKRPHLAFITASKPRCESGVAWLLTKSSTSPT